MDGGIENEKKKRPKTFPDENAFVVDNELLADLANLVALANNAFYMPIITRVRQRLVALYDVFAYKCKTLNPVEWRPREFNQAADLLADHVLRTGAATADIELNLIQDDLKSTQALQIFSDGGFHNGNGAAAVVLVGHFYDGAEWSRRILGHKGVHMQGARSAFHAEISALDDAVEIVTKLM